MSRQVTANSAPLDWYVQIGGLTIGILVMVAAPDWVTTGLKSAYNALPFAPDVAIGSVAQQGTGDTQTDAPTAITALRLAIIGQESGGRSDAVNHSGSGATGLGQVMPENISAWSEQCLGRSLSQQEFIDNPDLQVQVIDCKLSEYWGQVAGDDETRVRKVAAMWYSGQADLYDDPKPQSWNGNSYPSIRDYTLKVLERWKVEVQKQPSALSTGTGNNDKPAPTPQATIAGVPSSFVSVRSPNGLPCGGFAVAPDRIATAKHCISDPQNTIVIPQSGNWLKGQVIATAEDAAIVSVPGANFTPAPLGEAPIPGDTVTSWGHPHGADAIESAQIKITTVEGSIFAAVPASDQLVVDGFSGGIVVDADGRAIGLNSEANPVGMVKIQSIEVVKELLK